MRRSAALIFLCVLGAAAAVNGSDTYQEHCASCHDKPVGRTPSTESMAGMSPRRIVNSLESGTMFMPGRRLTPQERVAVAEYLTGKPFIIEPSRVRGGCTSHPPIAPTEDAWNGWSPDLRNARYQARTGISAVDIPKLQLRWAFGFDGEVMAFSAPAVFSGRVFVGSAGGNVYSLDAATGCVHWQYDTEAPVRTAMVVGAQAGRGYAVWFGDLHSNVYALDARTGALLWKRKLDPHPSARITGSPVLYEGTLYVGVSSFEEGMASHSGYACCNFRGSIAALNAATGSLRWQRFTIEAEPGPAGNNSKGTPRFGPSGAAVWATPTVDPKRGLLYVTTGDNYSGPATSLSDAVIALRLRTGEIEWARQVTPGDTWNAACLGDKVNCPSTAGPDHDFGSSVIIVRTGAGREFLIAAQKSGSVYALDPDRRGEVVWRTAVGTGGPLGGVQWGHAADETKIYVPISDVNLSDMSNTGGGLAALRLEDGQIAWKADPPVCRDRSPCSPAQMAAASVIPGAVFSGARDGIMRAYASSDGKVIWSFDTFRDFQTVNGVPARGGSIDGPGPVIAGDTLLFNSGYSLWNGRGGNVLLAFSPER